MAVKTQYRIIRFSPDPETVEHINVAILFNDKMPRIIYDADFPKLACVAPYVDKDMLSFLLTQLPEEIGDFRNGDLVRAIQSMTAQFQVSQEYILSGEIDNELADSLKKKYLHKQRGAPPRDAEQYKAHVESKLHHLLASKLSIPPRIMLKRASPERFLRPETVSRLESRDFKITRVISSENRLILLDSISFDTEQKSYIQQRATKISYAFYQMDRIKEEVRDIERRDMFKAAVIFGRRSPNNAAAAGFAVNMLEAYADRVVESDSERQLQGLRSEIGMGLGFV